MLKLPPSQVVHEVIIYTDKQEGEAIFRHILSATCTPRI